MIRHAQAALDLLIRRLENGPSAPVPPCARTALNSLHQLNDVAGSIQFRQIESGLHALGAGGEVKDLSGFLQRLKQLFAELNQRTSRKFSDEEALRLRLMSRSEGEKISDERLRSVHLIEEGDIIDVFSNVTELLRFNIDAAVKRSLLEYWFFPRRDVQNIADLGAGIGLASLQLAQDYPQAEIWSVDLEPISVLERPDRPTNIVNFGGHTFSEFHERYVEGAVPPMELVYIFFPTPAEVEDYCRVASQILAPQGFIHVITDSPFFIREANRLWENAGLTTRWAVVPDLFKGLSELSHDFDLGTHTCWLVARRGSV